MPVSETVRGRLRWNGGYSSTLQPLVSKATNRSSRRPNKERRSNASKERWNAPIAPLSLQSPLGPPQVLAPPLSRAALLAPPWLVSLTVHLSLILLLAFWAVPQDRGHSLHVVTLLPVEEVGQFPLEVTTHLQTEVAGQPTTVQQTSPFEPSATAVTPLEVSLDSSIYESGEERSGGDDLAAILGSAAAGTEPDAKDSAGAEFFGVQAYGRKFVFVVDNSNSMRTGKLDAAKEELLYAIRRLNPDQSFYVIFFHGDAVPMSFNEAGEPEPEPLPATSDNNQNLEQWAQTVDVDPWTNPHAALRQAVAMQPDAIFLLSDGRFTDRGETVRFLKTENYVRDANGRRPKVAIHTVGFHQRDGETTLKNIARSYGGAYRFVPPPK